MKKLRSLFIGLASVAMLTGCDGPQITAAKFISTAKEALNEVQPYTDYVVNCRFEGQSGNWSQKFVGTMNGRLFNKATNYDSFDVKVVEVYNKLYDSLNVYSLEYQAVNAQSFVTDATAKSVDKYEKDGVVYTYHLRNEKLRVHGDKDKLNYFYTLFTKEGLIGELEYHTDVEYMSFDVTYTKKSKAGASTKSH